MRISRCYLVSSLWLSTSLYRSDAFAPRNHGATTIDRANRFAGVERPNNKNRPGFVSSEKQFPATNDRMFGRRTHESTRLHGVVPTISSSMILSAVEDFSTVFFDASPGTLQRYFLEALITNGVPALFTVFVIGYIASQFRADKKRDDDDDFAFFDDDESPASTLYDDLYGDVQQESKNKKGGSILRRLLSGMNSGGRSMNLPKNIGVPEFEYIKVTHLNRKYDSYKYSLTAATQSKARAAATFRQMTSQRAWARALAAVIADNESSSMSGSSSSISAINETTDSLKPHVIRELEEAEQELLQKGSKIVSEIHRVQTKLAQKALDEEMEAMGMASTFQLDPTPLENATTVNSTTSKETRVKSHQSSSGKSKKTRAELEGKLNKLQRDLQEAELEFIQDVLAAVGPQHAASVRSAILGNVAVRGLGLGGSSLLADLQDRPLTALFAPSSSSSHATEKKYSTPPILYVTRFPGDTTASQTAELREEVTAIVQNARANYDEVMVVLETGGGTVTGYGLAAGQLMRLKDAGMRLTIAVEQVAASGGYMMCCIADHIVASPFAVLGSIGVISDIPNVYERLKREGIEFQTVTAGKFKRTLTPTKKVTKEDFDKTKQDVEEILVLFRDFVGQNRPVLNMEQVATGETWFGSDALERKLCDEIKTVDQVVLDYVNQGYDVYEISYEPPVETPFGTLVPARGEQGSTIYNGGLVGRGVKWIVQTIAAEIRAEFGSATLQKPLQERYLAKDDTADRMRSES